MGRFLLLPALDGLRLEYITVGVMVRELVPCVFVIFVVKEFEVDGKLILTGVFGSSGKNEFTLFTVELEACNNLGFGKISFAEGLRIGMFSSR